MLELDKRPSLSRLGERRVLFTQCEPDPQTEGACPRCKGYGESGGCPRCGE